MLTDCEEERDFVEQFSLCASEAVVRNAFGVGNPSGEPETYDEKVKKAAEAGAKDLAAMIHRAVEIVVKYRGYKSLAKERRELFSGDAFPSLGDETAAYSAAVEAASNGEA